MGTSGGKKQTKQSKLITQNNQGYAYTLKIELELNGYLLGI